MCPDCLCVKCSVSKNLKLVSTLSALETSVEGRVCKQCRSRWAGSYDPSHQDLHCLQVISIGNRNSIPCLTNGLVWIQFYGESIWSECQNWRSHVGYIGVKELMWFPSWNAIVFHSFIVLHNHTSLHRNSVPFTCKIKGPDLENAPLEGDTQIHIGIIGAFFTRSRIIAQKSLPLLTVKSRAQT